MKRAVYSLAVIAAAGAITVGSAEFSSPTAPTPTVEQHCTQRVADPRTLAKNLYEGLRTAHTRCGVSVRRRGTTVHASMPADDGYVLLRTDYALNKPVLHLTFSKTPNMWGEQKSVFDGGTRNPLDGKINRVGRYGDATRAQEWYEQTLSELSKVLP